MSGVYRPQWTPASLQNLNKNFAFFSEELVVVPPPPLTAAYYRDRGSFQLQSPKSLPPAPAISPAPPRPTLAQPLVSDSWRGQNLARPFAFFSFEYVVIPGPPLNAAFYRDDRQTQIVLPKNLPPPPPAVPDIPLPRVPVARGPIDTHWQRGWSLVQRNIVVGAIPPGLAGTIPNISTSFNSGTHNYDLSVYFTGATSYAISPAVEAGWSFNTGTGQLSIDTDDANTFGPYTVTATNAYGSRAGNTFTVRVSLSSGGGGLDLDLDLNI